MSIKRSLSRRYYSGHYIFNKNKLLKTSVAIVACLASSFNIYAQKAELDITLKRPDNNPATGIVTVTGNDSIRQEELIDGTAYFLLRNETGIKNQKDDLNILVYPNPVINGFVTIDLHNNNNKNYTIEAYNITGQLIDKAKMPFDNSMRIPAGYKSIILRFSIGKEKLYSGRLITLSDNNTNIELLTHNKSQTLKGAEITTSDDYEISYTDSTENLEGKIWYENIPIGTRYTIDEIVQWSQKNVFWEAITNNQTTATAVDLDDYEQLDQVVSADGNIAERSIAKRFNNENGLNIEYSLIAPYTDTAKFVVNQFMNDKVLMDTLRNGHFHLTVTGNGDNYVVKHNENVVGTGAVGSEAFFKLQKDLAALELLVNGAGLKDSTIYFDMNKGLRTEDMQLELAPGQYQHLVDGTAASSIISKLIKDGAEAYIVKAVGDTAFVNVIDGKFMYSWITGNPVETGVKIGVRNITGHQDAEVVADIDDNEAVTVTSVGDAYNASIPLEILNKYLEGIQGVSVSRIGTAQTTDAQGKATLIKNGLETSLYNEPLTSYADSIDLSATHINDTTINVVYVANLNTEQTLNIEELFSHMLNLYAASNIAGKNIKDGSEAWYSIVAGDTITAGTVDGAASFSFITKNKTENASAGVRGIAGHSDIKDAVIIDDDEDLNLEATGNMYDVSLPVVVKNQFDEAKSGLKINGMDLEKITDAEGKVTLLRDSLPTNEYNEALANYMSSLVITGDSIQTKNVDVNYVANVNAEQALSVIQEYLHWAYGNASSPDGASVEGWEGGFLRVNGTVSGNSYETSKHTTATKSFSLDSLVMKGAGNITEKELNFLLQEATQYEFDLEDSVVLNQYTVDFVVTEGSGDTLLIGKTLNVREPDGDLQQKVITGKNTQVDIEGSYEGTENVKVWLNEDTDYDGLTGTINQSLKLPLVSTWNDTLSVAINDVLAQQTYVAFMKKLTKTDLDIISIAEEGGNSEYNYLNGQGEREMNVYLVLETAQGGTTPNDIKQFYNEAVAMHKNKLTTDQGLELMTMNYDSLATYPVTLPNGTFYLTVDDTAPAPGNVKFGNLPETFIRGMTQLRTWDNSNHNPAILEFGGLIPLKDKPSTGGNSNYYIFSGTEIQDVKAQPLHITLMYKGLTIPDPTQ